MEKRVNLKTSYFVLKIKNLEYNHKIEYKHEMNFEFIKVRKIESSIIADVTSEQVLNASLQASIQHAVTKVTSAMIDVSIFRLF